MVTYTSALRAVGARYAQKKLFFIGGLALGIILLLFALTWILASNINAYWWLALIFVIPLTLVCGILFGASYYITTLLYKSKLSKTQRQHIDDYVEKIEEVAEISQFTPPVILFTMAKDLTLYRELRTFKGMIGNSTSLKRDLEALRKSL